MPTNKQGRARGARAVSCLIDDVVALGMQTQYLAEKRETRRHREPGQRHRDRRRDRDPETERREREERDACGGTPSTFSTMLSTLTLAELLCVAFECGDERTLRA